MTGKIIALISGLLLGSIAANVPKTFTKTVNNSNQQVIDFWSKVENVTCSDFDTEYGKTPGTCATMMDPCIDRTVVSATCNTETGKTVFTATYDPPGQFEVTVP
jgi:hypothetical protein